MFCYAQLLSKGKEQYSQPRKPSHELQNIKCKKTISLYEKGEPMGFASFTTLCLPYLWLLETLFMSRVPVLLPLFLLSKNEHNKINLKQSLQRIYVNLKSDLHLSPSLPGWREWKWKDKSARDEAYVTELQTQVLRHRMWRSTESQLAFCAW